MAAALYSVFRVMQQYKAVVLTRAGPYIRFRSAVMTASAVKKGACSNLAKLQK